MKFTAGGVVAVAGVAVAAFGVYFVFKKIGAIAAIPAEVFNAVNDAVPPGMTFNQRQPDGTIKKVTVTGEQIKQANANGANMGMIAWPSSNSTSVSPWYAGTGYQLEDWEKENPFGEAPTPDTKYSNFISNGVNWVGEKVSGTSDWNLGGWIYDVTH